MKTTLRLDEECLVRISVGRVTLEGDLGKPEGARGVILLPHGSGSSRLHPRNRFVAEYLREEGLATLSIDLLTPGEEAVDLGAEHCLFDIWLLAERLIGATDWLAANPATRGLKVGYYGASTGGCAALVAAAERRDRVGAIVSRSGLTDLVGPSLAEVQAPTLFIVGGDDESVIKINREAMRQLRMVKRLEIVPGATHRFAEPGTLEVVATLAARWFHQHL